MPLNLEGLVPDDDSVRLLSHELEEFDYSLLEEADGLSKETVFLDGAKLEACANKYTFVWKAIGFFHKYRAGAVRSSNLMILRHPLSTPQGVPPSAIWTARDGKTSIKRFLCRMGWNPPPAPLLLEHGIPDIAISSTGRPG